MRGVRRCLTLVLLGACRSPAPTEPIEREPASFAPPAYAACLNRQIKKIDLSGQFPPTHDQTQYGICFSYGATALFEAAFYRRDGKKHSFSPTFAACLVDQQGRRHEPFISTANKTIKGEQKHYLNGGKVKNAIEAILARGELAPDDFDKQFEIINRLHNDATELFQSDIPEAAHGTASAAAQKSNPLDWRPMQVMAMEWIESTAAANSYRLVNQLFVEKYTRRHAKQMTKLNSKDFTLTQVLPNPQACDAGRKAEVLQVFMSHLCSGIPLTANFHVEGMEASSDGGESWEAKSFDNKKATHSLALQGLDQSQDPPQFIFRNSWGVGNTKTPALSQMRISPDDLCKVLDTYRLTTNSDLPVMENMKCRWVKKKITCT